jgi:organic hydroperoxide reductase OsmC/OhrA
MARKHEYRLQLEWKGNKGNGTNGYRSYSRHHSIKFNNKPEISGSSDPAFMGDPACHNPEDLLLSSVAACHMLWYLSLCAKQGIVVLQYSDRPTGIMMEKKDGSGQFIEVNLNPEIVVADTGMIERAISIHQEANKMCFIANSVHFPIHHHPTITVL